VKEALKKDEDKKGLATNGISVEVYGNAWGRMVYLG
jgi:hypothetical protein